MHVARLVQPVWPPLAHAQRGWDHLSAAQQAQVEQRLTRVMAQHSFGPHPRDALLHLFTFLAQVETIAIEIPLRFLPHAPPDVRPLLRRQLVDEVFHSLVFARLAHELAAPATLPPPPLASAERLLQHIRDEPDLAVTATMLNLVAEGWIETLFKHALKWGVAPAVLRAVLADESRHVDEAPRYMRGMDPAKAQAAVHDFEQRMLEVSAEPAVALSIHHLAGLAGQRALADDLAQQHRARLRDAGLAPSAAWERSVAQSRQATQLAEGSPAPQRVPDTAWRRLARQVWTTPRDPTMQGDFDVAVGHIPKRDLTPVLIAALGQAWARHPELNRVLVRDGVWQLPHANVGVRVLLAGDELATVLIPEADRRSVRDIRRMLRDGIAQLTAQRAAATRTSDAHAGPAPDAQLASLMPPMPYMYAVAISNAGKWGVISGAGSFSGWVTPSTDFTVGRRRRLPRWRGVAYVPAWHVNLAAIQDHRVFDGRASSLAVTALQEALSPKAVRAILARPDTIEPSDGDEEDRARGAAAAAFLVPALPFALPKYTPYVIGGLGLGAVAGVAGYLAYTHFAGASAAGGAAAAAPASPPPPVPDAPDAPDASLPPAGVGARSAPPAKPRRAAKGAASGASRKVAARRKP